MRIPDKLYDALKWVCLVCIPGLNTFLGVLLPQLDVAPDVTTKIITIIAALGAFIGTLIGISSVAYKQDQ